MPHERILIVDDDAAILTLCRRILEAEGYSVVTTNRSDEALSKLDSDAFDLLLTDIRLPGLTGLEVTRRLRARDHDLGIVTMTGYSNMEMAIQALSLGVDEFIVKPFTPDSLRITVAHALEKSRLRRENTRLRALLPLVENSRAFAAAQSREELKQQIVEAAAKTIDADHIALILVGELEQSLYLAAARGP